MTLRRLFVACSSLILLWPVCARAQGAYGDHVRDRDVDSPPRPDPPEPRPAREPKAAPFGSPGQWVVTGGSSVGASWTTWSASQASSLRVVFSPGLDRFVLRNVSVGVSLNLAFGDSKGYAADGTLEETKGTTYAGGLRLGVNLPIAPRLSLYPRLTAGYASVRTTVSASVAGSQTAAHDGPSGAVDVPIVWEPRPRFFVAIVPSVSLYPASGQGGPSEGGSDTSVGAGFLVGGTFGGAEPPAEPEPAEDEAGPPLPRFGSNGVLVLSSELEAYGNLTSYTGTDNSFSSYGLTAGVDIFVADHVSVGCALSLGHSSARGAYVLGRAPYSDDDGTYGFALRAGVEVPLGRHFSLYPRLTMGYGVDNFDLESGTNANKGSDGYLYLNLNAPLLAHLARHFFVGFGPYVSTDLARTYTPGNRENKGTTVGVGLIVGGWL
jgi:opacity protein-like surface antigen